MLTSKIVLLVINLLGGIAVISSYILGLSSKNSSAVALWGGTPDSIKPIYTASMILAALGYFAFIYFILFKLDIKSVNINYLYLIFLGILLPSILWMPLTNIFIANASFLIWLGIRAVLIVVGVSSCMLAWFLLSLHLKETGISYWLALIGSFYFAFHTGFLDMILWPILFKR